MITFERRLALQFRAALRRCGAEADVPVLVRQGKPGLLLHARGDEFALSFSRPGRADKAALAFPASTLAQFEGRSDEPVELHLLDPEAAEARWAERGVARQYSLPLLEPGRVPSPPEPPHSLTPVPASFVAALHESSRSAAGEPTRYALQRVLVKGSSGRVLATNSRELLVWGGFDLPFADDVLVPSLDVFALPAFRQGDDPEVGLTDTHLFLRRGPWQIALRRDTAGRFPPAKDIIPKPSSAATRLHVDAADADFVVHALVRKPATAGEQDAAVTLDVGTRACLRLVLDGQPTEIALPRSTAEGEPLAVAVSLPHLMRPLLLGLRAFEFRDAARPFVARDETRLFLAMPRSTAEILPPGPDVRRLAPADAEIQAPVPTADVEATPSASVETDAGTVMVEIGATSFPLPALLQAGPSPEVLREAQGLGRALSRAAVHAGRLVGHAREFCARPPVRALLRRSWETLARPFRKETRS